MEQQLSSTVIKILSTYDSIGSETTSQKQRWNSFWNSNAEIINHQETCTKINVKENSSGKGEMITDDIYTKKWRALELLRWNR